MQKACYVSHMIRIFGLKDSFQEKSAAADDCLLPPLKINEKKRELLSR